MPTLHLEAKKLGQKSQKAKQKFIMPQVHRPVCRGWELLGKHIDY